MMKRHRSVTEPHALFLSNENNFRHQKELLNFTKSVVDLETEIGYASKPINQIVVQQSSTPQTLPLPKGTDALVLEKQHANLKEDGNFKECTEESVRQHYAYSPIKHSFPISSKTNERPSPNGQKRMSNGTSTFRDDEDDYKSLCNIHLSRVYFSQQSANGSQVFQQAQNAEFQPINQTLSSVEKASFKKRKVHFKEPAGRSMIPESKNLIRPNTTTDQRNIKGLFQKSSNLPKNGHSTKGFPDQYVYFLTDKDTSEECRISKQQDDEYLSNSHKKTNCVKETEKASSGEKHTKPEIQVVVDSNGRVHVVHGSQKSRQTEVASNTQVRLESSAQRSAVIDNPEVHTVYNTDPYCHASTLPTQVRQLQPASKKHIFAKIAINGSYSTINNNSCLQNMDTSKPFNGRRRTSVHEQQVRVHGNKEFAMRQAKIRTENRHSSYQIPANYGLYEYDDHYGYQQFEPQPMTKTHPVSYPSRDLLFPRDKETPHIVGNAAGNRKTSINCHANSEQKFENWNFFQAKRRRIISSRSYLDNNKQSAIISETSPEHSCRPHDRSTHKTRPQIANQPHGKVSGVEHANKVQSRNDHDTMRKGTANVINDGDQRYRCDWPACTKAFRHYSFLVLHRRIHTGERPYVCSWKGCEKQFRRSDDYQRHYRVHTGVKPYPCSICGKAFKRSDHRLFHYRAIHNMYKQ